MIRAAVYRLRPDVVHRSLDDEHFMLSADSAFHVVSDPVGAFVLDLLRGHPGRSLDDIVSAVRHEFNAGEADDVEADVRTFLDSLVSRNVLEAIVREEEG
jgi:hypothetical protein